jgi:hypothetical protein
MRRIALLPVLAILAACGEQGPANPLVEDLDPSFGLAPGCFLSDASAAAYDDGWQAGDNDGTGFGPWQVLETDPGNGSVNGIFVYTSTENGDGVDHNGDGDIDTADRAWGMYANSGREVRTSRAFNTPLGAGSTLSFGYDNGLISDFGQNTFWLSNAAGQTLMLFGVGFQFPEYAVIDDLGFRFTGAPNAAAGGEGIQVEIEILSDAGDYVMSITTLADGQTYEVPGRFYQFIDDLDVKQLTFQNANNGPGVASNLYANSIGACYGEPVGQPAFEVSGGVGDAIIRNPVFTGDKKGRTTAEEGIVLFGTGEILSNSLAEWRGGDGDHVGQVAHVGRGCYGDPYLADPAGKIALIERGVCPFSEKIGRAQLEGATGVIVFNSYGNEFLVQMAAAAGSFPPGAEEITIPVAFVTHSDGLALASASGETKMEGAAFEVLDETVEYIAESDGLQKEDARSLKGLVRDARRAARAGDYDTAIARLFEYKDFVVQLFWAEAISLDDANTLFLAADPIIAALEQAGASEVS